MSFRHGVAKGLAVLVFSLACVATAAPVDAPDSDSLADMGTFSTTEQEAAARVAVTEAEKRFQAVDVAAADQIATHRRDCSAPRLMNALAGLQAVERDSSAYIHLAANTPKVSDREAAMDVVEELDAFALDGYLRAAEALEISDCRSRASFIYTEVLRTYTGRSYTHWRTRASERLKDLKAGRPLIVR